MSDPVGERLRSYYQSIQGDAPARLEAGVARALDSAAPVRMAPRASWRPAFGLVAVGAAVLIVALVFRGLGPGPTVSPSGAVGPSSSPTATSQESPSASPTAEPSATPTPSIEVTPTPTPTHGPGSFEPTGTLPAGRNYYSATLLSDGRVLVAGGLGSGDNGTAVGPLATAYLYDPGTGRFTPTGSMTVPRYYHTATLLDDGRVLMAGGSDSSDGQANLASAELYDPSTGTFTATGSMAVSRAAGGRAVLLDNKQVLVLGGDSATDRTAELYDPTTGTFHQTGNLLEARAGETATLLADGRVLVAGGVSPGTSGSVTASAEIYDPATGSFSSTGHMSVGRYEFTSTLLQDGRVLLTGSASGNNLNTAELYDPTTGTFKVTGKMKVARGHHLAALLPDGRVLLIGGDPSTGSGQPQATSEIYDPATGTFAAGAAMSGAAGLTATPLPDGRVLVSGEMARFWELFVP